MSRKASVSTDELKRSRRQEVRTYMEGSASLELVKDWLMLLVEAFAITYALLSQESPSSELAGFADKGGNSIIKYDGKMILNFDTTRY